MPLGDGRSRRIIGWAGSLLAHTPRWSPTDSAPQTAPYPQYRGRQGVGSKHGQQHGGRLDRDERKKYRHQQDVNEANAPIEIELLETRETEAAHHECTSAGRDQESANQPAESRFG